MDSQPPLAGSGLISSGASQSCLLIVLRPQLTLSRSSFRPCGQFLLDDKLFRDAGEGDWTGFYDWLRDENANLLGVRHWPFENTEFLITLVEKLSYARVQPKHSFEVFFSQQRKVCDSLSCDQDFLYNPVFKADDGDCAVAYGIEDLTQANIEQLEKVEAHWLKLRNV